MSIISGFYKVKNYVKTTEGYKILSRLTSSDSVDVNGKTLTEVVNELGTAAKKDVAASGNASITQVVMGNDTRLTDDRKASDVSAWAKASTKPSYSKSEVGLGNVDNTADSAKSVKYATSAGSAPANGGNSATVNGHTVNSDVPANAKFTDTNTWTALKGATTSAAGSAGYVPAPSAGAANRYLRSDGTWSVPPDTNTTYDIFVKSGSGAKSGLVPAPSTTAGTSKFLREDGTWSNPPTAAVMTGATANANGSSGLVPQPVKGDKSWFLRGDGKWAVPSNTWRGISSTYTSKITDSTTTSLSQEGAYNLYTELNGNLMNITDVFFTKAVTGTGNKNRLRIYNFPVNENKKHTITIHSGIQYNAITGIYFCRYGIFTFSVNCGADKLYNASSLKCAWLIKQDGTALLSTITVENGNVLIKSTEWDTGTLILSAQANDAKVTFE